MSARALLAVALLAGIALLPCLALANTTVDGPIARINAALEQGRISFDQSVLYKAYFLHAPDRLPGEFVPRDGEITKCGAPLDDEIRAALDDLEPGTRGAVENLRARPVLPSYVDTEHFRIWYATSGINIIHGWPDTTHLHNCKVALERCWRGLVDTLNFRPTPPDGSDPDGGGGSDAYDCYIMNLSTGLYGYCQGSYSVPSTPRNDATSFIVVDNDFSWSSYPGPLDPMRITMAHEFGHGLQNSHDAGEKTWYKEATSMWDEEMMYDYVDDYISYLGMVLGMPYIQLDYNIQGQMRWYGMIIWNLYLSENYGKDIVPNIWYEVEFNSDLGGMDVMLQTFGTNLEDAVEDYCIWNWFTGSRDDGNHYEEGGSWPLAGIQRTYASYPVTGGGPSTAARPDHLACNYIHFLRGSASGEALKLTYDGPQLIALPSAAHVNFLDNSSAPFYYGEIPLNPWGNGSIEVQVFDDMHTVAFVAVNKTREADDMEYTIDAEIISTGVPEGVRLALAAPAPNPFRSMTRIAYSAPRHGGEIELSIYDVNGRLVTTLVGGEQTQGDAVAYWDGTNTGGERVASGVYFARLTSASETLERKIAVLR